MEMVYVIFKNFVPSDSFGYEAAAVTLSLDFEQPFVLLAPFPFSHIPRTAHK